MLVVMVRTGREQDGGAASHARREFLLPRHPRAVRPALPSPLLSPPRTDPSPSSRPPAHPARPPNSSFMERRGVRTDPLDQTSVVFMDTNEVIPTDLVIVKDKDGVVVPIS